MTFQEGTDQGTTPPALPPDPAPSPPTSGLFGSIPPASLTLGTAIEVAFKALGKLPFIGPILVISIVVNAILEITLGPTLRSMALTPGVRPTLEELNAILGAAAVSFVVTLLGGILVAVYGQVWAAAGSVGPLPTIGQALQLVGRRWLSIIGVSLLIGLISIGLVLIAAVVLAVVAGFSPAIAFGVTVGLVIAFVWFASRVAMAPWLAADGGGTVASLQGSWRITEGQVLRIVGWTLAYGLLFALLAGALGFALASVPLIGNGISQGISLALTYGAGVTLFRRTQAGAPQPPAVASASNDTDAPSLPTGTDAPIG